MDAFRITTDDVASGILTEDTPHNFTAFASDMRFPIGASAPEVLNTTLGNRMPFILSGVSIVAGDVKWWKYLQCNGCITLKVFNT